MKDGCPTVVWICLFLLLGALVSFNVNPEPAHARRGSAKRDKVSPDLRERARHASGRERIPVIIQFDGDPDVTFEADVESKSGRVKAAFSHFRARAVELPASAVEALADRPDVSSSLAGSTEYRFWPCYCDHRRRLDS